MPIDNISRFKSKAGFTLLEMAIAMMIIGLMAVPFINLYNINKKYEQEHASRVNLDVVLNAITNYKNTFGIYPAPAPMAIPRNNPAYGYPVNPAGAVAGIGAGSCGAGATSICVQSAIPARAAQLAAALPPTSSRVLVGSIPFRLLQVDEKSTADGYGSKYVYAITQSLTDALTFRETNGAIDVLDQANQSLTSPPASASFIVISPGPDTRGGYSLEGNLKLGCTGVGLDVANCNIGFQTGVSTSANSSYRSNQQNTANGNNHYDDLVSYFTKDVDPLWRRIVSSPANIETVLPGAVGIGLTNPDVSTKLDIRSSDTTPSPRNSIGVYGVTGSDGKIITTRITDLNTPAVQFDPSAIGGNLPGMRCPAGKFAYAISNNTVLCAAEPVITCPDATPIVVGTNPDGSLKCMAPSASCPPLDFDLCGTLYTLPLTPSTGVQVFTGGSCANKTYTCNGGSWNVSGQYDAGRCNFIPSVNIVAGGISCGFGYTGTYNTTTSILTCGGPATGGNSRATDCTCTGGSRTNTRSCASDPTFGAGYSGTETRTETKAPPSCSSTFSPWDTSACACIVPAITTRTVTAGSCPTGFVGAVTQYQVFDTAQCKWVDQGPPTIACTCNTAPITRTATPTCADPVCETTSSDLDIFQTTINASNCTPNPEVQTHVGTCTAKSFLWKQVGAPGTSGGALPSNPIYIDSSCNCSDYVNATQKFCYQQGDLSNQRFNCRCQ